MQHLASVPVEMSLGNVAKSIAVRLYSRGVRTAHIGKSKAMTAAYATELAGNATWRELIQDMPQGEQDNLHAALEREVENVLAHLSPQTVAMKSGAARARTGWV